jgi:biopolymer transport protein ExbD
MRISKRREIKQTKIEIIPMIDTMFFLLVFFILASLNIIDLRGLNLDLPPATLNKNVQAKDIKLDIKIDKDGNKSINGQWQVKQGKPAGKEIREAIESQLGRRPDAKDMADITVTILPDEETWHQYVIQVVDDARGANIQKFSVH